MSLVCCGAHVVINDDILDVNKFGRQAEWNKKWWTKPFYSCARCMSSLWGGSTYILLHGIDINIIPAIIATAFLNSVFINYYYTKS